jgi:hypothetical protein
MRDAELRGEEYTDSILDFANREAIRIYPEILGGEPEHISRLQDILLRHAMRLASDIDKLYSDACKP